MSWHHCLMLYRKKQLYCSVYPLLSFTQAQQKWNMLTVIHLDDVRDCLTSEFGAVSFHRTLEQGTAFQWTIPFDVILLKNLSFNKSSYLLIKLIFYKVSEKMYFPMWNKWCFLMMCFLIIVAEFFDKCVECVHSVIEKEIVTTTADMVSFYFSAIEKNIQNIKLEFKT